MSDASAGAPVPAETRAARFQKLFRTTAFKLSLAYLAIFALCAFLALGYVAWNARAVLDDQIVSTIDAEINGLSEQYNAGGLRRLITVVERRSREPGASLYLVTTAGGDHVVGNVGYVPAAVLATPGQSETRYGRNDSDAEAHRAIVRVFTLPGGFRLLVGRDTEERDRLRAVIGRAFVTSLAAIVLLGVIGGWLAASRVLRRVDAMTQTTRAIMAGDLDGRLHVAGNGDELDRLASSLNQMLERIGELMRGMREVSDNIAHDLKTPLTRLRNRADEALRRGTTPEDLRAALEAVIEEGDGLIRVFNALLMIARLESGSAQEMLVPLDVGQAVRSVGELYEALAEDQGLTLAVQAQDDLMIAGNRELIGQALANLIDNALKYGAGSVGTQARVTLDARRAGDMIRLTVSDHGPGIPQAERARVLDRFVRLEDARSRPGFGLGLSLVNAVVHLHHGTLRLFDNEPGLRIEIDFPAQARVGLPAGDIQPAPASGGPVPTPPSRATEVAIHPAVTAPSAHPPGRASMSQEAP
ncbi:ATP-binding protein [Methylobacterium sp. P5_C11]